MAPQPRIPVPAPVSAAGSAGSGAGGPARRQSLPLAWLGAALLLAGCATPPPASDPEALAEYRENNDPLEPANRAVQNFNEGLDRAVVKPVAVGYREYVPRPVRRGVRNVLNNLRGPVILLNDMLQGEPRRAGDTLGRFLLNSTFGVAGVFDVAEAWFGVPRHTEDYVLCWLAVAGYLPDARSAAVLGLSVEDFQRISVETVREIIGMEPIYARIMPWV